MRVAGCGAAHTALTRCAVGRGSAGGHLQQPDIRRQEGRCLEAGVMLYVILFCGALAARRRRASPHCQRVCPHCLVPDVAPSAGANEPCDACPRAQNTPSSDHRMRAIRSAFKRRVPLKHAAFSRSRTCDGLAQPVGPEGAALVPYATPLPRLESALLVVWPLCYQPASQAPPAHGPSKPLNQFFGFHVIY